VAPVRPAAAPVPPAPEVTAPAPTVVDLPDDDDDDALPSVGRVWEGPAPSLGAILKKHASGAAAPPPSPKAPPAPGGGSNVEAVDPSDLPAVWQVFLDLLKQHGPGLHSILSHGRFVGLEDCRAVIRFGPQHETFVKMLDRNGKKELVREAIARVLKQSIGVRFEVDPAAEGEAPAAPAVPAPQAAPVRAQAARAQSGPPEVAQPAVQQAPAVKITPELIESIRSAEPLVKALMDELGAQIVKVE
jgi:hypothetical protein